MPTHVGRKNEKYLAVALAISSLWVMALRAKGARKPRRSQLPSRLHRESTSLERGRPICLEARISNCFRKVISSGAKTTSTRGVSEDCGPTAG
jgi:hypothetical protein